MAIEVSLDTTQHPPVTVNPVQHNVNQGNQTIEWKPAAQQNFKFYGLQIPLPPVTPPNTNPFTTPVINDESVTVIDSNPAETKGMVYFYIITVTSNVDGKQYSSAPIPIGGGAGGNPSIKNN